MAPIAQPLSCLRNSSGMSWQEECVSSGTVPCLHWIHCVSSFGCRICLTKIKFHPWTYTHAHTNRHYFSSFAGSKPFAEKICFGNPLSRIKATSPRCYHRRDALPRNKRREGLCSARGDEEGRQRKLLRSTDSRKMKRELLWDHPASCESVLPGSCTSREENV